MLNTAPRDPAALPRLLITLGMLMLAGHWILRTLSDLFIETFKQAGSLVG